MDALTLPAGLLARPASRHDIAAITALIAACETADDGVVEIHEDDIVNLFDRIGSEGGVAIVVEESGSIVAWANLVAERAEADVQPDDRGRGIGRALLGWTETRARSAGLIRVRQTVTDGDTASARLFAASGYAKAARRGSWSSASATSRRRSRSPPGSRSDRSGRRTLRSSTG